MTQNQIKTRRESLGISQQKLAQEARCSVAMVRWLEYGPGPKKSEVRPRVLKALERAEAKA